MVDGEDTYFSNYIATWSAGSSITINEGEFSEDVYADAGTINITGGKFSTFAPYAGATGALVISGGIFDKEVDEEYCATGYVPADNTDEATVADYPYAVVPAVASIVVDDETIYFATLQDAVDTVEAGEEDYVITVINYDETMVAPEGWKFSTDVSVVPPVTTLVRAVSVTVTFELGDNPPENAVIPGPGSYAVGSALPSATCPDTNTSFAGWKVKDSDPAVIVAVVPADVASPIALVATWIGTKTVTVTESETTVSINVTDDWIEKNVTVDEGATPAEVTAAVEEALNKPEANGLPAWQNYVLGQDPDASVAADAEQGAVDAMPVVSTVTPQTVDTGFKVEYRLDAVDASGNVVASTEAQATPDLTVDLTKLTPENNVAYYKTVAVITSEENPSVTVTVPSSNTVGVLMVESEAKTTAIAVPWESLSDDKGISVADLVRTANLTPANGDYEGDELKAYDPDGKNYKAWKLSADRTWVPVYVSGGSDETGADAYLVKRGSAVWLTRQDTTQPIYLVGEVAATEKASVTLEGGTAKDPSWNLVGSASTAPVNVETLLSANPGDKVSVPTAYIPKNYEYNTELGKWGYWDSETYEHTNKANRVSIRVRDVFVTDDNYIPAGTGFWYQNSGDAKNINL